MISRSVNVFILLCMLCLRRLKLGPKGISYEWVTINFGINI